MKAVTLFLSIALVASGGCMRPSDSRAAAAAIDRGPHPEYSGREAVMFKFAQDAAKNGEHFFYVKIPGDIRPEERERKFETPLAAALRNQGLGRITGGGSQLGEGTSIEYCGLDVVVKDKHEALAVIRDVLRESGAPSSTTIEEYLPSRIDHRL